MKKIVAVLLAITMLAALCVPSFAAVSTSGNVVTMDEQGPAANPQADSSAIVKTDTSNFDATNGYYTLTFPAVTSIAWGTESTNLGCTVYANLLNNKKLSVSVVDKTTATANGAMTTTAEGISATIPFALGTNTFTTTGSFCTTTDWTPTVSITTANWDKAPISASYSANLTFSAEVIA